MGRTWPWFGCYGMDWWLQVVAEDFSGPFRWLLLLDEDSQRVTLSIGAGMGPRDRHQRARLWLMRAGGCRGLGCVYGGSGDSFDLADRLDLLYTPSQEVRQAGRQARC